MNSYAPLGLWGRRWENTGFDDGLKSGSGMTSIAEGFVLRLSASAQRNCGASRDIEIFTL